MSNKLLDLSLIKRLIAELELSVSRAESFKSQLVSDPDIRIECFIELSKSGGMIAGVITEATMLMGDLQRVMRGPANFSKSELSEVLDGLGGSGSPGNSGSAN